jgi:hypothetical protein
MISKNTRTKSRRGTRPKNARSKSSRGGARPGAGRPKKFPTTGTLAAIDIESLLAAEPPAEIEHVAQKHAHTALASLVKLLMYGSTDSAKVSAANEVLDRGYGKPAVEIGGEAMLPFMRKPEPPTIADEIRIEARKYAHLAVGVLNKIADAGSSENARASASKSLLARGLGTVAPARMPDEFGKRPLGKKEEAQRAAESAATGRYATPSPPALGQNGES